MTTALLDVRGLTKVYPGRGSGRRARVGIAAVDDVSFCVAEGEAVGIAGESGSGKTTLARMILRLETASAGSMRFAGADVAAPGSSGLASYRRQVQAVFQDSSAALSPRMRIRDIVAEPLVVQEPRVAAASVDARVDELLVRVGLSPVVRASYPHQLSGGQKQRVAIARALILHPRMLVLDEPVSALDVSIRSQVLNLLIELQEEQRLAYLIIAHDLAVLRHVTRDLVIIYRGRVVEAGPTDEVLFSPAHPYTRMLIAAVPRLRAATARGRAVDDADAMAPPAAGCAFAPRCPLAHDRCRVEAPQLAAVAGLSPMHRAACHALHPASTAG